MTVCSEKIIRITLVSLLFVMSISAFGGGCYGMAGAKNIPVEWLKGSPFTSYFIPSLVLLVVIGGSCFVAAILVLSKSPLARKATFLCMLVVFSWLSIQLDIIGYVSWMQPATAIAALLISILTWFLPTPTKYYTKTA